MTFERQYDRHATMAAIAERIGRGESLHGICASDDMPGLSTVMRWLDEDVTLREQYARAHIVQADWHHHKGHEIAAERPPNVGDTNHKAGESRMDSAFVAWQRLRWDAHRWSASQLHPKKYGKASVDVTHAAPDGGPVQSKVTIEFISSPAPGSVSLPVGQSG